MVQRLSQSLLAVPGYLQDCFAAVAYLRFMNVSHPVCPTRRWLLWCLACSLFVGALAATLRAAERYPDWARDVVWYQIFPERFANGDPGNDPPRRSLEAPWHVTERWTIMDWTADWYARAAWEREMSPHFYDTVYRRRYGGDLQGVLDRLDYLEDLGITGIYFNPVFYADSLHKYDGNSFHHIDPYFGPDPEGDLAMMAEETSNPSTWQWTAADKLFLRLLEAAKARGIRVIIDGVWNHTGRDFFAFADIREHHRKSRYARWYDIVRYDDPRTARNEFDYRGWHGFKSLPEFADAPSGSNLAPGPKRYIFHATERWMDPDGDGDPSDGIDGWRLDVAEEVPAGFWREWHALVRRINPEAFTSAEIWGSSADFLERCHFGSAMNYRGFAIPVKGWLIDASIPVSAFVERLAAEREARSAQAAAVLQNLVDSHDTQRVGSMIANRDSWEAYLNADWFDYDDAKRVSALSPGYELGAPDAEGRKIWKMLAVFQATYTGAPMVYYGTAAGMYGADDPDDRMPMWWPQMEFEPQTMRPDGRPRETPAPVGFDAEIFKAYREAIALRHRYVALRRGGFSVLEIRDASGLLVFERTHGSERVVVALNRGHGEVRLGAGMVDDLEQVYATAPAAEAGRLPPRSAAVFAADAE